MGKLEENKQEFDPDSMNYSKLYSVATANDKILLYIGWLAAALTGFGLPSFILLLGDVIDSFGSSTKNKYEQLDEIKKITIIITFIGVGIWITSYIFYGFLLLFSEKVARRTKVAYLRAILK